MNSTMLIHDLWRAASLMLAAAIASSLQSHRNTDDKLFVTNLRHGRPPVQLRTGKQLVLAAH